MERAETAEGVIWIQSRKVARKDHKRERQRRRRCGRGWRRKKDQGPYRQRSGCRHPGEGKYVKNNIKRPGGRSFMRSWDCSQIDKCRQTHLYRAPHFLMHSCCAVSFVVLLSECSTLISMHLHGSRLKHIFVSHLKTLHTHRAMFYTVQTLTPRSGTPSSPFPEPAFQDPEQPCQDPRPQQCSALTEPTPLTGYEPNPIVEDREYRHFTGDGQFIELEVLRVRPLPVHQSITASTYDSAGSMATPLPESDLHDEQLRTLLASPPYLQEREASAERRKFITQNEKT